MSTRHADLVARVEQSRVDDLLASFDVETLRTYAYHRDLDIHGARTDLAYRLVRAGYTVQSLLFPPPEPAKES